MAIEKTPEPSTQAEAQTKDELRIVLFGHNNPKDDIFTIIKEFTGDASAEPDTPEPDTPEPDTPWQKINKIINNKKVVIVDTPGLGTGSDNKKKLLDDIKWSVALAKPGPHVFLFVERIYNPLGLKLKALKDFQETFGEQVNDFTMLVFSTDDDQKEESKGFRGLTYPFKHRYFVNTMGDKYEKQRQANELFDEIQKMREEASETSAHFYTPKMLWEAEKAMKQQEEQEEKEREEWWSNIRDKGYVVAAHFGATIGMMISNLLELDSESAGGVGSNSTTGFFSKLDSTKVAALGSIVAVILFAVVYLVVKHKYKTKHQPDSKEGKKKKQESDSKEEKEPTSVRICCQRPSQTIKSNKPTNEPQAQSSTLPLHETPGGQQQQNLLTPELPAGHQEPVHD